MKLWGWFHKIPKDKTAVKNCFASDRSILEENISIDCKPWSSLYQGIIQRPFEPWQEPIWDCPQTLGRSNK